MAVDEDVSEEAPVAYTGGMKILGIDPGTGILGFGVIEVTRQKVRMVDAGVI